MREVERDGKERLEEGSGGEEEIAVVCLERRERSSMLAASSVAGACGESLDSMRKLY